MKQLTAHIECGRSPGYSAYIEAFSAPFFVFGEGATIEAAKADFYEVYECLRHDLKERTGEDFEAEFTFVLDASALLRHLPEGLTLGELSRRTGISLRRLWQYRAAKRSPREPIQEQLRSVVAAHKQ